MVRRHRFRYLMERWRPRMIQPANQDPLRNYRKPLGISSNHEIPASGFWPWRAQGMRGRPQRQNHQKPLGKSSNHQTMDCDLPKTVRIIIKSSNGIGCLGWDTSQGSGSGGDLRNRSRIPWFDDYMHEIMKSSNHQIKLISWSHTWNHQIIK